MLILPSYLKFEAAFSSEDVASNDNDYAILRGRDFAATEPNVNLWLLPETASTKKTISDSLQCEMRDTPFKPVIENLSRLLKTRSYA